MKNILRTISLTAVIIILSNIQVFATGADIIDSTTEYIASEDTSNEAMAYNEKAQALKAEINSYTAQIKELRDYNTSVNQKLKLINEKYKLDKNSFSSDKLKAIKELRKSIKSDHKKEQTVKENNSVKSLVKNKEYDKALLRLNEILEAKKEQLKVVQERNAIWRQIDALIG